MNHSRKWQCKQHLIRRTQSPPISNLPGRIYLDPPQSIDPGSRSEMVAFPRQLRSQDRWHRPDLDSPLPTMRRYLVTYHRARLESSELHRDPTAVTLKICPVTLNVCCHVSGIPATKTLRHTTTGLAGTGCNSSAILLSLSAESGTTWH